MTCDATARRHHLAPEHMMDTDAPGPVPPGPVQPGPGQPGSARPRPDLPAPTEPGRPEMRGDMRFTVGGVTVEIEPDAVVVAGFTGRDEQETRAHLDELAEAGVTVPTVVPTFYSVPPSLLVQRDVITVIHGSTSGEAEIALVVDGPRTYVTLASDHTDRVVETSDIGLSKAVCEKIMATEAWPLEDVLERWDLLELRSWRTEGGERTLYQDGLAASLLPPRELLAMIPFAWRPERFVFLTGTLPAIGGIRSGEHFSAELRDPLSGRSISLEYCVRVLDLLTT